MPPDNEEEAETPEAFLAALTNELKADEQSDADLADILGAHILKADPSQSCVTDAKSAIEKLARKRAQPKPDQTDG